MCTVLNTTHPKSQAWCRRIKWQLPKGSPASSWSWWGSTGWCTPTTCQHLPIEGNLKTHFFCSAGFFCYYREMAQDHQAAQWQLTGNTVENKCFLLSFFFSPRQPVALCDILCWWVKQSRKDPQYFLCKGKPSGIKEMLLFFPSLPLPSYFPTHNSLFSMNSWTAARLCLISYMPPRPPRA